LSQKIGEGFDTQQLGQIITWYQSLVVKVSFPKEHYRKAPYKNIKRSYLSILLLLFLIYRLLIRGLDVIR
jgi:hypothetical protein